MYSLKIEGVVSFRTSAPCVIFAPKKHKKTKRKMHIYLFDLFDLMLVINKNHFAILHKKRKRGKSNLSKGMDSFTSSVCVGAAADDVDVVFPMYDAGGSVAERFDADPIAGADE